MMEGFLIFMGCMACGAVVIAAVVGLVNLARHLVEDHRMLVAHEDRIKLLDSDVYKNYWGFNGRIAALEEGKNDGKVKAKG